MKRHLWLVRLIVIALVVGGVEALCRTGVIDRFTMQPPSEIAVDLWKLLRSGKYSGAIYKTLSNAGTALVLSLSVGILAAIVIHRIKLAREALDHLSARGTRRDHAEASLGLEWCLLHVSSSGSSWRGRAPSRSM